MTNLPDPYIPHAAFLHSKKEKGGKKKKKKRKGKSRHRLLRLPRKGASSNSSTPATPHRFLTTSPEGPGEKEEKGRGGEGEGEKKKVGAPGKRHSLRRELPSSSRSLPSSKVFYAKRGGKKREGKEEKKRLVFIQHVLERSPCPERNAHR